MPSVVLLVGGPRPVQIDDIRMLRGHVRINSAAEALSFVRLATSPGWNGIRRDREGFELIRVGNTTQMIVIVLNPASGRGTGGRARPELERALHAAHTTLPSPADTTWEIVETTGPGDGIRIAREAVRGGATVVAAAGGDGTLGEVVNGIAGGTAQLALLPLGTGNDFARNIGLLGDLDLAAHTLFHGEARPVDLGRVGDRWFINVAGCGFDAVVAARVNRGFRRLHGTHAYVAAVLQSLATFKPTPMRLTIDGESREMRGLLCSIANAPMYGGGMRIAPDARIDDGWFDVCLLGDAGKLEFIRAFPRVFKGTHITHPKVTMLRAQSVLVESEVALPVLVDGEVIGVTPAGFTIAPGALLMRMPAREPGPLR